MTIVRMLTACGIAAAVTVPLVLAGMQPARAQDECASLWHRRNAIYARNGYCFRTARARAVFGPGCFPPYGELSRSERRAVNRLQAEEDALGCPP